MKLVLKLLKNYIFAHETPAALLLARSSSSDQPKPEVTTSRANVVIVQAKILLFA